MWVAAAVRILMRPVFGQRTHHISQCDLRPFPIDSQRHFSHNCQWDQRLKDFSRQCTVTLIWKSRNQAQPISSGRRAVARALSDLCILSNLCHTGRQIAGYSNNSSKLQMKQFCHLHHQQVMSVNLLCPLSFHTVLINLEGWKDGTCDRIIFIKKHKRECGMTKFPMSCF